MKSFISAIYPDLLFSTPESAKEFAEKLEFDDYEIQKFYFLSNDESKVTHIGYVILKNNILFQ